MPITVIPSTEINKQEFSELVVDLLEDFVHGDSSPFKDVKSILEDYLDTATDLDPTQKAGIFADWLKGSYDSINKDAMSTAVDILKTNSQLSIERYGAQSGYNLQVAQEEKVRAEIALLSKEDAIKDVEIALAGQKLVNEKAAYLLEMAKLKKQFGYGNSTLDAALDLNLGASTNDGAIDRQIDGYTKLNYKDMLKTLDEKAALMQNAKVGETVYEKAARIELLFEVSRLSGTTTGLNYTLIDGTTKYTYEPNSTPFGGKWSPDLPA